METVVSHPTFADNNNKTDLAPHYKPCEVFATPLCLPVQTGCYLPSYLTHVHKKTGLITVHGLTAHLPEQRETAPTLHNVVDSAWNFVKITEKLELTVVGELTLHLPK